MGNSGINLSAGLVPKTGGIDLSSGFVPAPSTGRLNMPMHQAEAIQSQNAPVSAISNATAAHAVLPTAGMVAGGMIGGAIAGPVGATAGSTYGGAVGEAAAQHLSGEKPNSLKTAEAAATGGLTEFGGEMAGKAIGAGGKAVMDWLRPKTSAEVIPELQQAARKISEAVSPTKMQSANVEKNLANQTAGILDYAKKAWGRVPKTRWEFAKAAEEYGTKQYDFYTEKFLKPFGREQTVVSGQAGSKTMTINAVDHRLGEINDLIYKAHQAANEGVLDANMVQDRIAQLKAEQHGLRSALYKTLSEKTNWTPDEIHELRQSFGQSRSLSRDVNQAVRNQGLETARKTEGGVGSLSIGSAIGKGVDKLRGSSSAISDRMFQRAIKGFPGEASPLKPVVSAEVKQLLRNPIWKNIDVEKLESNISKLSPEEQKAVVDGMQKRMKERVTAKAEKLAEDQMRKLNDFPMR